MAEQVAQNTADLYGASTPGGRPRGWRHQRDQPGRERDRDSGHGVDGNEWRTDDHCGRADHHGRRADDHDRRFHVDGAGQLDIGDWVNASPRTAVVVSAGSIITPTGTYQPLTSGGVVTTSTSLAIANGVETGDLLLLRNANASDAITVDGTGGNVECKTDKALGAGDTLMLILETGLIGTVCRWRTILSRLGPNCGLAWGHRWPGFLLRVGALRVPSAAHPD